MDRPASLSCCVVAVFALAACATRAPVVATPDFDPVATQFSARARLYADCIAEAAAANRYGYAYDELHVVVFTCDGIPARAFFDALEGYATETRSEVIIGDRVIRPTTRIERDLFAADYCERSGDDIRCSITLRTGEFVRP